MTNITLDQMTLASALDGTEVMYGIQAGIDVEITPEQIKTFMYIAPIETAFAETLNWTGPTGAETIDVARYRWWQICEEVTFQWRFKFSAAPTGGNATKLVFALPTATPDPSDFTGQAVSEYCLSGCGVVDDAVGGGSPVITTTMLVKAADGTYNIQQDFQSVAPKFVMGEIRYITT